MSREGFNASVRATARLLEDSGLREATVCEVSLPASSKFNGLCLTSKNYPAIYDLGLSLSHYNVLLKDFSYFQFSYVDPDEYALAYYPNPRLSGSQEAVDQYKELERERDEGSLTDEEFSELASEIPARTYIPRVRFEYSASQYRNVRHPAAHFHVGMSGEDRWPSSRKLSPSTFTLLMVRLYMPDAWWTRSRFSRSVDEQALYLETCIDKKLVDALQTDGSSGMFSNDEQMTFHFGALSARST